MYFQDEIMIGGPVLLFVFVSELQVVKLLLCLICGIVGYAPNMSLLWLLGPLTKGVECFELLLFGTGDNMFCKEKGTLHAIMDQSKNVKVLLTRFQYPTHTDHQVQCPYFNINAVKCV